MLLDMTHKTKAFWSPSPLEDVPGVWRRVWKLLALTVSPSHSRVILELVGFTQQHFKASWSHFSPRIQLLRSTSKRNNFYKLLS